MAVSYLPERLKKNESTPKLSVKDRIERGLSTARISPTPVVQQAVVKAPVVQPIKTKTSFKDKVIKALSYPSEKVEQLVTRGQGYEKALENPKTRRTVSNILSIPTAGLTRNIIEKSLENEAGRRSFGFGTRMVADPLNFIPVTKGVSLVNKFASKVDDVAKVSKLVTPVREAISPVTNKLGKTFIKGYGLPETYNVLKNEIPTTMAQGATKSIDKIKTIYTNYGDLTDEGKDAVAKFLEPKGAGLGTDLKALKQSLIKSKEWGKIQPMLNESRKILKQEVHDAVQSGMMTGEKAQKFLTQGGYFPHTDFASKGIKKWFTQGRQVGVKGNFWNKRKGAEGFTLNAPKAIAFRELGHLQDSIAFDFLKTVRNGFGYKQRGVVKEGFYKFGKNTPKSLMVLRGWALPQKIADDLLAMHGVSGKIPQTIDAFNRFWKPTVTSVNPAFHFMNIYGNLFNSWIGGMKDPRRFLQAVGGRFDESEKAILEGSGILSRGQFGQEFVKRAFNQYDLDHVLGIFDSPSMQHLKKFTPRQIGNFFENNARSAFFLNAREKFLSKGLDDIEATRKAVAETNKYLFDYLSGLTPFETNYMRRVFPFYTWSRFNIPLQLQSIITQPGKYAAIVKLYRELNKGHNVPENELGIGFPTPFTDGNGDPIRWTPNLPVQDIFNLNPKRIKDMAHPLIKEGAQVVNWASGGTPIDPFSGRPRTDTRLPVTEQFKDVGGGVASSLIRPYRSVSQFTDEDRTTESWLDLLIGGFYVNNQDRQRLSEIYKQEGRNSAIENRIRNLPSNLSPEERRAEADRLLKMMQ